MAGREAYAEHLGRLREWRSYLVRNSGLPGPRGNIELAQAAADLGTAELFQRYLDLDTSNAASDSEKEYLVFCAVLGLGRLAAEGAGGHLATLKRYASDPRWRIREAVAMALQRIGSVDTSQLLRTPGKWAMGGWLEQRAAAAGLCEPALLRDRDHALQVLEVLHGITVRMAAATDRSTDAFRALRKGMGYCWSVAVVAVPREGKKRMERWMDSADADVAWVMKENLGKRRMARMDAEWVEKWTNHLRARKAAPRTK